MSEPLAFLRVPVLAAGLLALTVSAASPQEDRSFSSFSGTWVGKRSSKALGTCAMQTEDAPLLLVLAVDDEGKVQIHDGDSLIASGTINRNRQLQLENSDAFARCGKKDREYAIQYSGRISSRDQQLYLEFEGEDAPCPPDCAFLVQYRAKKQDLQDVE